MGLQTWPATFIKQTPAQVHFCEFWETFKNTYKLNMLYLQRWLIKCFFCLTPFCHLFRRMLNRLFIHYRIKAYIKLTSQN